MYVFASTISVVHFLQTDSTNTILRAVYSLKSKSCVTVKYVLMENGNKKMVVYYQPRMRLILAPLNSVASTADRIQKEA